MSGKRQIAIYTDEDVPKAVAEAIRRRGLTVSTTPEHGNYQLNIDSLKREIETLRKRLKEKELKPKVQLRSKPIENLSDDDVRKMLKERDFFDSSRNKQGKGLNHQ